MKFIFPTQLIHCEPLEALGHRQRIDLTVPNGIAQLAKAILDDWTRRGSQSL